ncbi:MAG: DUF1801 domain-containing protein [Sphingomonadaceae bacterium]|nr:DUF1801 domain-containing protein [Sphingomonadaceae bacterium]
MAGRLGEGREVSEKLSDKDARSDVKPILLSGGNPQIAKGYGDAPVQAYIAAMPGSKQAVGRRIDAIIERAVAGVRKAVKWNSPLYGAPDGPADHWFLSYHCFDRYVKIAFHRGAALDPPPPVASRQKDVRYYHIHEGEEIDEARFADWVKQASRLPGEKM